MTTVLTAEPTYRTYLCRDRRQAVLLANGLKIALRRKVEGSANGYSNYLQLNQLRVQLLDGSVQPEHLERLLGPLERQYGPIKRE